MEEGKEGERKCSSCENYYPKRQFDEQSEYGKVYIPQNCVVCNDRMRESIWRTLFDNYQLTISKGRIDVNYGELRDKIIEQMIRFWPKLREVRE